MKKQQQHLLTITNNAGLILLTVKKGQTILDTVCLDQNTCHLKKQSVIELVKTYRIPKGNVSGQ